MQPAVRQRAMKEPQMIDQLLFTPTKRGRRLILVSGTATIFISMIQSTKASAENTMTYCSTQHTTTLARESLQLYVPRPLRNGVPS